MKKIVSVFCFLLALSFVLPAQDAPGFRFGFQSSPTWSWLRTSDKKLEGVGSNWGLKLGAMGEYYFTSNYAFIGGLGFGFNQGGNIQNGYEMASLWDDSDLSEEKFKVVEKEAKLHYRLNYVEIPFGLKMRGGSNEDARIKFYAEIPVFTIGFVTRAQGDIRGSQDKNTEDEDIRDDVKGLSLAWGLGGGIEYEFASSATLVAGLAFQQQFTDVTGKGMVQKNPGDAFVDEKSKGNIGLIALKLGVFF
ncbi:MAG: outer membrane beta-barrel protein [Lewinellaceae bacterium]|nr:outer membrane beta-barrel protein [Lewinellaceae bacterium]